MTSWMPSGKKINRIKYLMQQIFPYLSFSDIRNQGPSTQNYKECANGFGWYSRSSKEPASIWTLFIWLCIQWSAYMSFHCTSLWCYPNNVPLIWCYCYASWLLAETDAQKLLWIQVFLLNHGCYYWTNSSYLCCSKKCACPYKCPKTITLLHRKFVAIFL